MVKQEELKKHIASLKQWFDRGEDGEAQLIDHLKQLIEFRQKNEQNEHNQAQDSDIFQAVQLYLSEIIKNRPLNGRLKDNRHELRAITMQLYNLFTNYIRDNEPQRSFIDLVSLCFEVIKSDSEEITDIAIKILSIFTSNNNKKLHLEDFKEQIIEFIREYLNFLTQVPQLARDNKMSELEQSPDLLPTHLKNSEDPNLLYDANKPMFLYYGCKSFKTISKFVHQILRQHWHEDRQNPNSPRVIESVKEQLFKVFTSLTMITEEQQFTNLLVKMKAVPFFAKALDSMSIMLHSVQYLVHSSSEMGHNQMQNIQYLKTHFGNLIHFFINLARSLPAYAVDTRHQAIIAIYQLFNKITNLPVDDSPNGIVKELRRSVEKILLHYMDQLLEKDVLMGQGHVNFNQLHESANLVYRFFEFLKEKMTSYFLAKAMQYLLQSLVIPMTPLILQSTIIFCMYKLNNQLRSDGINQLRNTGADIIQSPQESQYNVQFSNTDFQIEMLESMTILCKRLRQQTEQGTVFFEEEAKKREAGPSTAGGSTSPFEKDEENIDLIYCLKEADVVESCNQPFKLSWQNIIYALEPNKYINQGVQQESSITMTQKKEHYSRTAKNLFLFVENVLIIIKELQQKSSFSLKVMTLIKEFFINGCHLIQNLSEIFGPSDEKKMSEVCRSFQILIHQLRISQFRDLLNASGNEFFGLTIESKVRGKEGGIAIISKYFFTFTPQNMNSQYLNQMKQSSPEDFVTTYLDMFFCYIKRTLPMFNPKNEGSSEMRFGLTESEKRLAKLPFQKVQETMQKKLFTIGEQCLHRANDMKVKHTFFGVFMFCMQQIRSGHIVPRYFTIIRNLWKEICNLDEQSISIKEIMRDFIPMIQGLIETFLQQKDEVTYVKYTKEICCFVPAKLKHLLDYLPAISKPLVENMESHSPDQVESGVHTLQYWLTALATYPELFDPVIQCVLPELNACLKPLLTYMPNISLKLMGKLGSKTRQYDRNNEFKPRNYSEDGLKIQLQDKHSKEQIVFGIDAIIDVLLIKILSYGEQFLPSDLTAAIAFVKCAFLTYVDKDLDLDYIMASIVAAKQKDQDPNASIKPPPLYQSFDARKPQEPITQMTHGSESHVFEKILRCLIIGCSSLPAHTPEFEAVAKEHKNFMKWVAQYFTLIYICKNKTLTTQPVQMDEINSLLFLDYICEFLYYNINQGLVQAKQSNNKSVRPYYKGSSVAIKTMLRLLKTLYGDQPDAFDNLEIIPILISKICSQVEELPKNLAVNIAIQILIKELPQRTMKKNCHLILKTLFQILTTSSDSVVISVQEQLKPTLDSLFETIGVYTFKTIDITTTEDRNTFNQVVDRIMQNLLSPQQVARQTAQHFLETIARRNRIKVLQLLQQVKRQSPVQAAAGSNPNAGEQQPENISWHDYIYEFEIENRVKEIFEMYCGGYAQIQNLIQFIEIVQFMLQHGDPQKIKDKDKVFICIVEQMIIMLENETEKMEEVTEDTQQHGYLQMGPNQSIQQLTKRYMKLERIYQQQSKEYDAYSHTLYNHQFLTQNYFEILAQAKDNKLKKDIESLKERQTNTQLRIFEPNTFKLSPEAEKVLTEQEENQQTRVTIKKKIDDFTFKLFGNVSQFSRQYVYDISYDYMHDLYEIYPNVRHHCTLISKMLELLCDVLSYPQIYAFIKPRQVEFFEPYNYPAEDQANMVPGTRSILKNKFDYYVVEIKAKSICMMFKFFQRNERNVQKRAKDCLKRLLKQEHTPNDVLPNFILKECVRPILNSLSQNKHSLSNFQHLGKLIKVCFSCFNDQLSKHLTRNYEHLETQVREPFQIHTHRMGEQGGERLLAQEQVQFLVEQYNIKVQQIETAIGIVQAIHFLCQQNPSRVQILPEVFDIMSKSFSFEKFLIQDFEQGFDSNLSDICKSSNEPRLYQHAYDRLSPIRVQMGYLCSDIRKGVAKFFCQSHRDPYELFSQRPEHLSTFLQIVKERENFVLRERIQRDIMINKYISTRSMQMVSLDQSKYDENFTLGVKLVHILSKFQPHYLLQPKNVQILDGLREKWINKLFIESFLTSETRNLYMSIQKILIIYCKQEQAEVQIIFDLLKDFQMHSTQFDMRPLIKLCTKYLPEHSSLYKKQKILEACLSKLKQSHCRQEAKYLFLEFAFLPIFFSHCHSKEKFFELMSPQLIQQFFKTIFSKIISQEQEKRVWMHFYAELELRQKISYQSFFIEIVKVLLIFFKYCSFGYLQQMSESKNLKTILQFLVYCQTNSKDQSLKELTLFALSCYGVRALGLQLYGQPQEEVGAYGRAQEIDPELVSQLQTHLLIPFYDQDFNKTIHLAVRKHTFANCVTIFQDPTVARSQRPYQIWEIFRRKICTNPKFQYQITMCEMISNQYQISQINDSKMFWHIVNCVDNFCISNYNQGILKPEMLTEFHQPMTLVEQLVDQRQQIAKTGNLRDNYEEFQVQQTVLTKLNHALNYMVELCLFSVPTQQNGQNHQQFEKVKAEFEKVKGDFVQILKKCLSMQERIQEIHRPFGQIADRRASLHLGRSDEDLNSDKSQYKLLVNLNRCGSALRTNIDVVANLGSLQRFLHDSLPTVDPETKKPTRAARISFSQMNYKLILFPIHLIREIILMHKRTGIMDWPIVQEIKNLMKQVIRNDVRKSNEREHPQLQGQMVLKYLESQQQVHQYGNVDQINAGQIQAISKCRQDEVSMVAKCLPHLSIRFVAMLEKLRDEGDISQDDFESWADEEIYINASRAIVRVVTHFRMVVTQERIISEQGRFSENSWKTSYADYKFENSQAELSLEEPNLDRWIKESIMISIKSNLNHMKRYMHQDKGFNLFEQLKLVIKVIFVPKTCLYLLEQLYEVTKILIIDSPQDRVTLILKDKHVYLRKLLEAQKLKDTQLSGSEENSIINKIYNLSLDFLECQTQLLHNEQSLKIFDRIFQLKPCCSYPVRQRIFKLFEKFQGAALKHKIAYFMSKMSNEDTDTLVQFAEVNNLLDFTLFNFKQDISIFNIKNSSILIPLHNRHVRFNIDESVKTNPAFTKIQDALTFFNEKMVTYKGLKLEDLFMPLSEIIRINPEHSHDRDIAGKIFSKIFWQYWQKCLHRQDHHQLSADFNKMLQNIIKSPFQMPNKQQFSRTMLEQIVALKNPQVRIEPEILQYMAKNFNLWHLAIPMLEDHIQLFPQNERYYFALQELYNSLMEEDLSMGLSRLTTKSKEMRSLYSFAQHQMWEQVNTQFSSYINFYAEQEGLFSYLEAQQQKYGKYSRQLPQKDLITMTDSDQGANSFAEIFEGNDVQHVLDQSNYPRAGSNREVSELDLRTWESLFIKSVKVLKKNELFRDIAENIVGPFPYHELKIDYFWSVKNMDMLKKSLHYVLDLGRQQNQQPQRKSQINQGSMQRVKYYLYQNYIYGIEGDKESRQFDENFKETVKLAIKQWSEYLPGYMDRIQNEYLILFQQIMESNEGGRNMISNNECHKRKHSEYRCAMNIWRERLPSMCESIQTWQDILESRNFIFQKLKENIVQFQQPANGQAGFSIGVKEEFVDICWNNLKLAEISRKQGLYGLAQHYLKQVQEPLTHPETTGDTLKLERFRYLYEMNKLHVTTELSADKIRMQKLEKENEEFIKNQDYDLWMTAEIHRLQGEYSLKKGDIESARAHLVDSIKLNRKEARTWMSYARLNEIALEKFNDDRVAMNSLKGYFCATGLQQHKARLIIPFILRLLKNNNYQMSTAVYNFVIRNIAELPVWLWLFWIPQLLQFFKQPKETLQHKTANQIFLKLCKLYPQPVYHPLRSKLHYMRRSPAEIEVLKPILQKCKTCLKNKGQRLLESIEIFIQEMGRTQNNQDDASLQILQSILNLSQFYFQNDIPQKISNFLKRTCSSYFKNKTSKVADEFQKYFINPETMEKDLEKQMIILKNIKDFLLIQKSLRSQPQTLEEVFQQLAALNVKGIELPDQYILSHSEPLPEKVISISSIDSTVQSSGVSDKKIQFKCSNGRTLAYTFQNKLQNQLQKDYNEYLSDERVNQLKLIMNMLFMKNKESMRRNVKFHVTPRTLLPGSKMTQEDVTFTDFQETHDYLLLEQGIDPDSALLSQLAQINKIYESFPEGKPKVLASLDASQVQKVNSTTLKQMCERVEPYLLQSFFNRIFYNHDNLFIFKKQFTKCHAINSFFAYVFNQAEFLKLSQLSFCKATGCLNFTETKLKESFLDQKQAQQSFDEIEANYFKIQPSTHNEIGKRNLPFRLTPNLVHFIGRIGLHGIFSAVQTSASLALRENEHKLQAFLKIIFCEELSDKQDQSSIDLLADQNANYCLHKIKSLSSHNKILVQAEKTKNLQAPDLNGRQNSNIQQDRDGNYAMTSNRQQTRTKVPKSMMDLQMDRPCINEEFNAKVFSLIEMAQDEERLSQREINWFAWF